MIFSTRTAAPLLGLATLTALGLAAAPAQAQTTLNFDNFTAQAQASGGATFIGTTYDTQGFTLSSSDGQGFFALAGNDSIYGDGETSLGPSFFAAATMLTQDNGQAFSLNTIDLGPAFGNSQGSHYDGPIQFTGTRADGTTVNATEIINDPNGQFQTFDFAGFTDLTFLTFGGDYSSDTQSGSIPQFDNVVLTPAAVPEASTTVSFGLLLVLGGLLLHARKRKAAVG